MGSVGKWWNSLGRPERIVAMSLAAGGAVAIVNSTVWAIAVSYMAHQKALVALTREQLPLAEREAEEWPDAARAGEMSRRALRNRS
jgi:hypothetical protein